MKTLRKNIGVLGVSIALMCGAANSTDNKADNKAEDKAALDPNKITSIIPPHLTGIYLRGLNPLETILMDIWEHDKYDIQVACVEILRLLKEDKTKASEKSSAMLTKYFDPKTIWATYIQSDDYISQGIKDETFLPISQERKTWIENWVLEFAGRLLQIKRKKPYDYPKKESEKNWKF